MRFNEIYSVISGIAYVKGIDHFDWVMPKERVRDLYFAALSTNGCRWVMSRFIHWIVCIAGRESRRPVCRKECKYRMRYAEPDRQRNALRIEIFSFADRCGWDLKEGRIGGHPDDYYPCSFAGK